MLFKGFYPPVNSERFLMDTFVGTNSMKNPVPPGYSVISGRKDETLNAYLGTCVGVTLCDRFADVGGLIHLILSEPVSINNYGNPENYAVTGLPMFIDALVRKGAAMERLEATVAGGALVGPVSDLDLELDIGGRTIDVVKKILGSQNIPIKQIETGGFFSCKLGLNLLNWESHIKPINAPLNDNEIIMEKPSRKQLEGAIASVRAVPQVVLKVIRMIQDEKSGMPEVAREMRQDQVISAKVIKMCNSAYFSRMVAVDSIDRALALMGEKQILRLILSAAFEDLFSCKSRGYSLCKGGLFYHALGTAMICEKLAGMTGIILPDVAYTAGLLHDIGKIALDQCMGEAYPFFYRRTQLEGDGLIEVEREAFGISHDEVGEMLAVQWSLPESIKDVIRHHHYPENASTNVELAHLVYLADLIMSRFFVGQELERLDTQQLGSRLERLGFKKDQLAGIVDKVPPQMFDPRFH
jgi:putative nucleotidyltransferase with HDIG domain